MECQSRRRIYTRRDMKRADPRKDSASKNCDAKMVIVKLLWANESTRNIESISPTIQGRLKEAQKSTMSGGRARRWTAMSSVSLPGGGRLMLQPGRSRSSTAMAPRLSMSLVLGGGRGGLSCPNWVVKVCATIYLSLGAPRGRKHWKEGGDTLNGA